MDSKYRGFTNRLFVRQNRNQASSVHGVICFQTEEIHECRRNINGLCKAVSALSHLFVPGIPDKKWQMGDFVVGGLDVLSHPVVLSQKESVIGIHNQHGIPPQTVPVHGVQHFSEIPVTHRNQGRILLPDMADFPPVLCRIRFAVSRPVKDRTLVFILIKLPVFLRTDKRLMRIEALDL